jgi:hypothetical protein
MSMSLANWPLKETETYVVYKQPTIIRFVVVIIGMGGMGLL